MLVAFDGIYMVGTGGATGTDGVLVRYRTESDWTAPSPLSDNLVPDILPTVAPTDGGALLAWNQYHDGEYPDFAIEATVFEN